MFWETFWPNLASDILAGAAIGVVFGWFIARRLSALEGSQQRARDLLDDLRRAEQYLTLLQKEITDLTQRLPSELRSFSETGWGREVNLETPFWETIDRGGELPRLLNPNMVEYLTRFYNFLAQARRGKNLLIQTWLVPSPQTVPGMQLKVAAFINMTESNLSAAIALAPDLLDHVTSNLNVLDSQIKIVERQL